MGPVAVMTQPGRPELDPADVKDLVLRLRRAQGQLGAVAAMLEDGRGCREVVTQLAAAKKAIDRVGFALFEGAMQQCLTDPESSPADQKAMQKLFLSLS